MSPTWLSGLSQWRGQGARSSMGTSDVEAPAGIIPSCILMKMWQQGKHEGTEGRPMILQMIDVGIWSCSRPINKRGSVLAIFLYSCIHGLVLEKSQHRNYASDGLIGVGPSKWKAYRTNVHDHRRPKPFWSFRFNSASSWLVEWLATGHLRWKKGSELLGTKIEGLVGLVAGFNKYF